jgi:monovalent cation:proton antiporter-2 (CPA2) family protein
MNNILNQALIFIGSSILMVPLFHRLGFGSVLGYLMAGVVVGPYGLKLIYDSDSVMHIAELGVIFLLFVIGLEIQPRRLWNMKKDLIGLGGVQIFSATIIFAAIGMILGFSPVTSFVLSFGMALSSTAFAIQSLTSKNNFNTDFGKSSFSILLMQDLMAIPALAIIPNLGVSSGSGESNWPSLTWLFPLFLVLLILISRFLIQPFFRIIARTNQREIFTATALFIVLSVAMMTLKIGLSAALGTFIAGVLLADSEYRHELEANLDPFKSLLLGLFFISVGMTVSLPLIVAKPLLVIGLALVYLLSKGIIIYCTGRLFKMSHFDSKMMSFTIAQGGEFAFVIFGLALTAKIADAETLMLLTAIITLSMAISPLVVILDEKLQGYKVSIEPVYDDIKDEHPQVIIAGFGRFGQMFGRILRAQQIPFVAIDRDADQVELLRKYGNKIYFGDVMRLDLLEAAGTAKAKYFVLAIDDPEALTKAAQMIKKNFPNIEIFARARNRGHAFDLLETGVKHIKRETFDSSVNFVGELLVAMGVSKEKAQSVIRRFSLHDQNMLLEQYKVRNDDEMFMSKTLQAGAQLSNVLNDETSQSYIGEPEIKT